MTPFVSLVCHKLGAHVCASSFSCPEGKSNLLGVASRLTGRTLPPISGCSGPVAAIAGRVAKGRAVGVASPLRAVAVWTTRPCAMPHDGHVHGRFFKVRSVLISRHPGAERHWLRENPWSASNKTPVMPSGVVPAPGEEWAEPLIGHGPGYSMIRHHSRNRRRLNPHRLVFTAEPGRRFVQAVFKKIGDPKMGWGAVVFGLLPIPAQRQPRPFRERVPRRKACRRA